MKKLIGVYFLIVSLGTSCSLSSHGDKITDEQDYEIYLTAQPTVSPLQKIDSEINFWQKRFIAIPDDIVARTKIASLLTQRFSYSGKIEEIYAADSLYQLINVVNRYHSSSTYRALAANCITKHRFRQALAYIDTALKNGDNKYQSVLMEFDISMELGDLVRAKNALMSLTDKSGFEYLIRKSKFSDHAEGNLDEAILLMEQAYELVSKENDNLWLWTKSNLADLYSHANRFEEAYNSYLSVLAKEPRYYHALKGIAWLAFSKDGDVAAARKILSFLKNEHPVPDYDLLLAEVATEERNTTQAQLYRDQFVGRINNIMYGDMYNKYLFNLQITELANPKAALIIAEKEVNNRPTGEAYSWLAWAYLNNGQRERALEIVRSYVEKTCFEPDALYYIGKIYEANGNDAKAKEFLNKALESRYELGPATSKEIESILKTL